MPELREFKVKVDGIPHSFQLDQDAAKRHGLEWDAKTEEKKAAPANKAAKVENK